MLALPGSFYAYYGAAILGVRRVIDMEDVNIDQDTRTFPKLTGNLIPQEIRRHSLLSEFLWENRRIKKNKDFEV